MGTAVARKGAWGVYADVVWTDLGGSSAMPPVEVDPTLAIMSMNVLRRITPYADATAGVRWNHLSTRVELGPPLSMNLDKSRDWVDPVVGVVLRSPELGRFHGAVVADIGGFGVSSDFTWQVFPPLATPSHRGCRRRPVGAFSMSTTPPTRTAASPTTCSSTDPPWVSHSGSNHHAQRFRRAGDLPVTTAESPPGGPVCGTG
jgi:hypothetical protein